MKRESEIELIETLVIEEKTKEVVRFQWLRRDKFLLGLSASCLIYAAVSHWYLLPKRAFDVFQLDSRLIDLGRGLAALSAVMVLMSIFWEHKRALWRTCSWLGLALVLLYPYIMMTWQPSLHFLATSYATQEASVALHVDRNFPNVQAQWQQNLTLQKHIPVPTVFDLKIADAQFFQLASWSQLLVDGLGYNRYFFKFIGRGWIFATLGFFFALLALYWGLQGLSLFLTELPKILLALSLILFLSLGPLLVVNIFNYQLDTEFALGNYAKVITQSRQLLQYYPLLEGDEEFLVRLAKASFYRQEPDNGLLPFARGIEYYRTGKFTLARAEFEGSLKQKPRFLVRGFLAATWMNQGVSYFNQDLPQEAAQSFENAEVLFPGHVEALYNLMIAQTVSGEFEASAQVARKIVIREQYSAEPNLSLIGQAYLHMAWASYRAGQLDLAWKQYQQSHDDSLWKPVQEDLER
jgi:tetratricopeptide (TPR) repeat protein